MSEIFQGREKLKQNTRYLYAVGLIGLNFLTAYYFTDKLHLLNYSLLPWSTAAALFYVAGRVADTVSTIKVMDVVRKSEAFGIPQDVYETNPHLPDRPTKKDLLHPKNLIFDIGFLISSIIFPPYGVAFSIGSFYAAINNSLIYRGIKKDINRIK